MSFNTANSTETQATTRKYSKDNITGPGLQIDLEAAERYLKELDSRESAYFDLQTFDDHKVAKNLKDDSLTTTLRQTADDTDWLKTLAALNKKGAGIYCAVNEMHKGGRGTKNLKRIRGVFGDFDNGAPDYVPLEPSVTLMTSTSADGTVKGAYIWLLEADEHLSEKEFAQIMQTMVTKYGADKGAKDTARVLRIPGFYHQKDRSKPQLVSADYSEARYTREQLLEAFPATPDAKKSRTISAVVAAKSSEIDVPDWAKKFVAQNGGARNTLGGADKYEQKAIAIATVRSALAKCDFDDRSEWNDIGLALAGAVKAGELDEEEAFDALGEYSERSAKYDGPVVLREKWDNDWYPNTRGDIGLGSIFHRAKGRGWVDPRKSITISNPGAGGKGKTKAQVTINAATIAWPVINPTTNKPITHIDNAKALLQALQIKIHKDVFRNEYYIEGLEDHTVLNDEAAADFRFEAERFGLKLSKDLAFEYLQRIGRYDKRHPVRDYLDSLTWDGTPRVENFLRDYFGAADDEYTRAVSKTFLVGAVRRVRRPGAKNDYMLVAEGPEGIYKSTAIRALASNNWFTDALELGADPKEVIEITSGKWIVEVPELGGMSRSEVEKVKAQLSRVTDRARAAYERKAVEIPRQFVMIGTTNEGESSGYLMSDTGNRRFLPVKVTKANVKAIMRDRDQIWAEAAALEAQGVSIVLPKKLWAVAGQLQEQRRVKDPIEERLEDLLADVGSADGFILTEDIYSALGCDAHEQGGLQRRSTRMTRIVRKTMAKHGYEVTSKRVRPATQKQPAALPAAQGKGTNANGKSLTGGGAKTAPIVTPLSQGHESRTVRGYARGAGNIVIQLGKFTIKMELCEKSDVMA